MRTKSGMNVGDRQAQVGISLGTGRPIVSSMFSKVRPEPVPFLSVTSKVAPKSRTAKASGFRHDAARRPRDQA